MNKKFLALCAVATAFVFTGCQKEKDVQVDNAALTHTIAFTAEKGDETRTAIASEADGLVTYKWIAGDEERMHVYEKVGEGNAVEGTVTSMDMSSDGSTATFYVTFEGDAPTGNITYTATYGGTVSNSQNPLIPSDQYPGVDTFDPAADAMVAEPIVKEARDENPSFRFKMHRQASVNKMTLKGLPVGEKIEFVSFESDKYHYGYATPAGNVTNGGKKLTMHYTANNTVPASGEFPVYFTTAGVENATFTVTVKTDQHRYVKNSSKTITFSVGRVRRFGVDMTGTVQPEGRTFTLVENVSDLVIGSDIVIAANGSKNSAMSITQTTNNRGVADATKSADGKTLTLTENVQIFTLEAGTVEGSYAFHCANGTAEGYIYAASSSKNWLKTQAAKDDNASWAIQISNKEATVKAQGENSNNILRYNSSNNIFSCYSSGQQSVYLYQAGSLPDPGMSWSDEAAVATLTSAGVEFTPPILNLGNATNVTYASSKPTVATIDNNGNVTIVGAGQTVISAIFAGNTSYAPSTVTYTLTVTDSREKVATPTFSPAAGAVDAGTVVTISTTTAGATIYYTVDGTAPTTASTQGTTVTIDEAKTIKAIAVKANYIDSDVATAAYSLTTPGATIATILADDTVTAQHTVHYDLTGVTVMAAQSGTSTKKNYIIADETGVMLLYCNVSPALVVGSQYNVQGDVKLYNGVHEFSNPTVQSGTGTAPAYGTPEEMTVATLAAYTSAPVTKYAKVHVTAPASGFDCTDGTNTVNVFDGTGTFNNFRNKAIIVTGYLMGYYSGKVQFMATAIEEDATIPTLFVSPTELLWEANEFGASNVKTVSVSVNSAASGYTVTGTSSDWTVTDDGNGTISVYPNAANASTTANKEITLTITHDDDATLTETVTCRQMKKASGGTNETLSGTFTMANESLVLTTSSGLTVTQAKGTGSAVNSTYNTPSTLRVYKGHTLSFSGKTITKIAITVNGTYFGNSLNANCGTLTPTTSSGGTIIWEGESDSVTITNVASGSNVQLRPASIVVTYK